MPINFLNLSAIELGALMMIFDLDGEENPYREKNPAEYLDAFKKFLAEKNFSTTWQKVMDELKKISDWSQTRKPNWDSKVKSMSDDVRKVFLLLAKFAEFSSVGRLTGQGFGQARVEFFYH